jgi:hypothetical protein
VWNRCSDPAYPGPRRCWNPTARRTGTACASKSDHFHRRDRPPEVSPRLCLWLPRKSPPWPYVQHGPSQLLERGVAGPELVHDDHQHPDAPRRRRPPASTKRHTAGPLSDVRSSSLLCRLSSAFKRLCIARPAYPQHTGEDRRLNDPGSCGSVPYQVKSRQGISWQGALRLPRPSSTGANGGGVSDRRSSVEDREQQEMFHVEHHS